MPKPVFLRAPLGAASVVANDGLTYPVVNGLVCLPVTAAAQFIAEGCTRTVLTMDADGNPPLSAFDPHN